MNLQIGITDLCNYECIMCLQTAHNGLYGKKEHKIERLHKDNRGFISLELFKKILDDFSDKKINLLKLQWLGESFIHPQFSEILRILAQYDNIDRIVFTTNLSTLNSSIIKELQNLNTQIQFLISLDSTDPLIYKKIKGRDLLLLVEDNIKTLMSSIPEAIFTFQTILMDENKHHLDKFIKNIKSTYDVSIIHFNESSVYLETSNNILIKRLGAFEQKKYDQLHFNEFKRLTGKGKEEYDKTMFIQKASDKNICPAPFRTPTINWDGTVVPCCMDSFLEIPLGNINESSFDDIWTGNKYRRIREAHLKNDLKEYSRCKRCSGLPDEALTREEIACAK